MFDQSFVPGSHLVYTSCSTSIRCLRFPTYIWEPNPQSCLILILQAEDLDDIQRMRNTPDFFNKLVDSIAPTVFGHQDIKRAILLMLLGGVHKFTHEGINLRGDLNVCIVGDPSCAKSQFLKYATISAFIISIL